MIGGAGSIGQAVTIEIFKRNPKKRNDYGSAMKMSAIERRISFLNNYFVYKKMRDYHGINKVRGAGHTKSY